MVALDVYKLNLAELGGMHQHSGMQKAEASKSKGSPAYIVRPCLKNYHYYYFHLGDD